MNDSFSICLRFIRRLCYTQLLLIQYDVSGVGTVMAVNGSDVTVYVKTEDAIVLSHAGERCGIHSNSAD